MSNLQEASQHRRKAEAIVGFVKVHGPALCIKSQLAWMGVAEALVQLAAALELPALEVL